MFPKKNQTVLKVEALESRWMPAGLNPGQLLDSVHDRPDGIVFVDKSLVDEVPAAEFGDDLVVAVDGQSDPVEQMGAVIRAGDGIRSVRGLIEVLDDRADQDGVHQDGNHRLIKFPRSEPG